jgi:TonB family protein
VRSRARWAPLPILAVLATATTESTAAADTTGVANGESCRQAVARGREHGRPVPWLCAVRKGDRAVFVLSPSKPRAADPSLFELETSRDSCDVELSLRPAGFARGRWPCDREGDRLLVPLSPATRSLLLGPGVTIERVSGVDLLSEVEIDPAALWTDLFGSLPDPLAPQATYEDNGVYDDETLPEVLIRVAPKYPKQARKQRIEGTVLVKALVSTTGSVAVATIQQSVPGLDQAALDAIRQWAFRPALDGRRPVPVWVVVPVKFNLE